MSHPDVHSYANFDEVIVRHIDIALEVDFERKVFKGHVDVTAEVLKAGAEYLCLDVDGLAIESVRDASSGGDVEFLVPEKGQFGSLLRINLPHGASNVKFTINYTYVYQAHDKKIGFPFSNVLISTVTNQVYTVTHDIYLHDHILPAHRTLRRPFNGWSRARPQERSILSASLSARLLSQGALSLARYGCDVPRLYRGRATSD